MAKPTAVSDANDAAFAAASIVLMTAGLSAIIEAVKESWRIFQRMNSYATYRIAETLRVLFFMTLAILVFNFYPVMGGARVGLGAGVVPTERQCQAAHRLAARSCPRGRGPFCRRRARLDAKGRATAHASACHPVCRNAPCSGAAAPGLVSSTWQQARNARDAGPSGRRMTDHTGRIK